MDLKNKVLSFFILLIFSSCSLIQEKMEMVSDIDSESRKKMIEKIASDFKEAIFDRNYTEVDRFIKEYPKIVKRKEILVDIANNLSFFNNIDMFVYLFDKKKLVKDINQIDTIQNSYIVNSASRGNLELFKIILKMGGKPLNFGSFDRNLLHMALNNNDLYLFNIAVEFNIDPSIRGFMGRKVEEYDVSPKLKRRLNNYIKNYKKKTK